MNWSRTAQLNDRESELTDQSPFPFGQHRGVALRDMPSEYLDWFAGQEWAREWPALLAYVQRSRKAIDQDLDRASRDEAWQPDPMDDVPY